MIVLGLQDDWDPLMEHALKFGTIGIGRELTFTNPCRKGFCSRVATQGAMVLLVSGIGMTTSFVVLAVPLQQ